MNIKRVTEELKKQLSIILRGDFRDPRIQGMISVHRVTIDTELTDARIYVSTFTTSPIDTKEFIAGLHSAAPFIKMQLKDKIRLRKIPNLTFIYDYSEEYAKHIDEIIQRIHKEDK